MSSSVGNRKNYSTKYKNHNLSFETSILESSTNYSNIFALLDNLSLLFSFHSFEIPFFENPLVGEAYALTNTWGFKWDEEGEHGPEPYIEEYMMRFRLPHYLENKGFEAVEVIDFSYFESIFKARKPLVAR